MTTLVNSKNSNENILPSESEIRLIKIIKRKKTKSPVTNKRLEYIEDMYQRCDEIKELIEQESVNIDCRIQTASGEEIPIILASQRGYVEIVKLLINYKADVNIFTIFDHRTALHTAVINNKDTIVEILLKNNANVNCKNRLGQTPLMLAAQKGYEEIVKILLNNRHCDIKLKDNLKNTALSYAVDMVRRDDNTHYKTAKLLVNSGSNVNVIGMFANSVAILHCAAAKGDLDFVKLLVLEKGADVRIKDEVGKTALDYAVARDQNHVVEYLQSVKPNHNCCLIL